MRFACLLLIAACSSSDVGIGTVGRCTDLLAQLDNEAVSTCTVSKVGATVVDNCAAISARSPDVGCNSFTDTTSTMTKQQLLGGETGLLVQLADPTTCEFRACE